MRPTFETLLGRIINHEGGLSLDPSDPGNWTGGRANSGSLKGTKFGIAANTYPNVDIPNLTLAMAQAIYHADYWLPIKGDELPQGIAFQVLDAAVNSGCAQAIKFLQRAASVHDDGVIGPKTLLAARRTMPIELLARFNAERLEFMTDRKNWPNHGKGWARRIAQNLVWGAQDAAA